MKRTVLIAAGLAVLGAACALSAEAFLPSSAISAPAAVVRTATFAIKNMTCALCPVTVRTAMEHVAGVKSVKVDFGAKTATAVYDPAVTNATSIAKASTGAGYPAAPIRQ